MQAIEAAEVKVIALRGFMAQPGKAAKPGECVEMTSTAASFAVKCGHARLATAAELAAPGPGEKDDDEGDEDEDDADDKDEDDEEDQAEEGASSPLPDSTRSVTPANRDPSPSARDPRSRHKR